jgi:glycosyltransferase involved in cell wall biosynthesis
MENNTPKKILIIYEFFYPAYKAGGIIQSLKNLVATLDHHCQFYVITGGFDLGEAKPLTGIQLNAWSTIQIDNTNIQVWYDDKKKLSINKWKSLFATVNPDIIYINGFMHLQFLLYPLIALRSFEYKKIIIAPRGMLQKGAVEVKSFKKFFYLLLIKFGKLTSKAIWHFTSEAEKIEANQFGWGKTNATVIPNLSLRPIDTPQHLAKEVGSIQLVYASIITPKKNLHYLIQALCLCKQNIVLDIYGVVKENDYWESCSAVIAAIPSNIKIMYHGAYEPSNVGEIINKYHAMILLSKAENFSHAIVESLSSARPVISSEFTSWNNLEAQKAGWNISINSVVETARSIDKIALTDNAEFETYYHGALILAQKHYNDTNHLSDYKLLFS